MPLVCHMQHRGHPGIRPDILGYLKCDKHLILGTSIILYWQCSLPNRKTASATWELMECPKPLDRANLYRAAFVSCSGVTTSNSFFLWGNSDFFWISLCAARVLTIACTTGSRGICALTHAAPTSPPALTLGSAFCSSHTFFTPLSSGTYCFCTITFFPF